MNNLIVCGGLNDNDQSSSTCESLDVDSESWFLSHQLDNFRCRHGSWDIDESVYLIGGDDGMGNDAMNYEILSKDGSVSQFSTTIRRQ